MLQLHHSRRPTYSSGVSGFFEDLSGRPDLLLFLATFQSADLLLHPHAQTLHHLYAEKLPFLNKRDISGGVCLVHGHAPALLCW